MPPAQAPVRARWFPFRFRALEDRQRRLRRTRHPTVEAQPRRAGRWFSRLVLLLRRQGVILSWVLICTTSLAVGSEAVELWERQLTGEAQELVTRHNVPASLLIVAIDDYSLVQGNNTDLSTDRHLQTMGNWPWPRAIYGLVLERLFTAGAELVAIDLIFDSESSYGSTDDHAFAKALSRYRGRIVLGMQAHMLEGNVGGISLTRPIPPLLQAVGHDGIALLNGRPDSDGVIRERPSSFARQLKQSGLDSPTSMGEKVAAMSQQARKTEPTFLERWSKLLSYYGPPYTVDTIPIWDLLEPNRFQTLLRQGKFKDRIVFIGPTATILQDLHITPVSAERGMAGVEIHATETGNRLEGRSLHVLPLTAGWVLLAGVMVLLMSILARRWERPLIRLGWMMLIALGCFSAGMSLIAIWGLGARFLGLSVILSATGLVSAAEATIRLQWQRLRLRRLLERYLSPAVADEIIADPDSVEETLRGRGMEVTVLMSDIKGFTTLTRARKLTGQSVLHVQQLNQYPGGMVEVIQDYGGTVDKFIGDAVMAVFGSPVSRGIEEEAIAALRCAFAMRERLSQLNAIWEAEGIETLDNGIGLASGEVIVGQIGSPRRMEFTVIGDTVNLSARMESMTRKVNQNIVFEERTAEILTGAEEWEVIHLGDQEVKGIGGMAVFTARRSAATSTDSTKSEQRI